MPGLVGGDGAACVARTAVDPSQDRRSGGARAAFPVLLLLGAGLFAWWGVWNSGFKFDDRPAIVDNDALLAGDWWRAAFSAHHQPLANRPLSTASLAFDFAVFGPGPFGPHLMNLLLHLANALLVFALARASLTAPNLAGRFAAGAATRTALAMALLWVVHPLGTDAVAYATQRSTLLASCWLLLALLATARAATAAWPARWQVAAVVAVALGMASKEDMVGAPFLVLLYVRAFLVPDWRALARHRWFVAGLAATWLVLAACVLGGPRNPTVGWSTTGVSTWQWLLTQAGVVVSYLRLSLWPAPLRGAYDLGITTTLLPAVLPGLLVLGLLALTVWLWRKAPPWGWLGALFFVWLAPTSSVLPIVTEIAAERRAYLPMLAVLAPVVLGARSLLARALPRHGAAVGGILAAGAAVALALASRQHAAVYADERAFWQDAFDKRDPSRRTMLSSQILGNHGALLYRGGRQDEACELFELAMQCDAPSHIDRTWYAVALQRRGRHAEAVANLERAIAEGPRYADAHATLGTVLLEQSEQLAPAAAAPLLQRAAAALEQATRLAPRRLAFWNTLGVVRARQGDFAAAEQAFARATALPFERIEPFLSRAQALRALGRAADAERVVDELFAGRPRDVALRLDVARQALAMRDVATARRALAEVLRLEPGHDLAIRLLRELPR